MPLTTRYSADLPPVNETGLLKVKIVATDAKGNTTTFPRSGDYSIPISKQGKSLKINEIMAKNQSSITDDYGQHEDWIEITNCDTTAVNTAQSYLSDDAQDLGKWQLPSILMNPGELIYVWADDDEKQGDLHTNFKLDGEGETIYLSVKYDTLFSIIDSLKYAKLPSDISYGALAEGSGNYSALPVITPGYPNATRGLAFAVFNVDMAEEIGENRLCS